MFFNTDDGVQVHYDDVGAGPPVVLIHGAAGAARAFDELVSHLIDQFRAITIDLRGLGRSERVSSVSSTAWCDDVIALLDYRGIDSAHFVGCSLGARIAGRLALDHRARLTSLCVDAPILSIDTSASAQLNTRFSDIDNASAEDVARWRLFHGDDWPQVVQFYGDARNNPDLQSHLTLRPRLAELDLPTLITRGDIDDRVHPLSHAVEWHDAHPSSWMWIAPDTGFSLMQRRPKEFAMVFARFAHEHVAAPESTRGR